MPASEIPDELPAGLHPGEFLHEIIEELGVTQAELARALGISPMRVSLVLTGARPVTAELALRLSRALRVSARYWLDLQADYDLKVAQAALGNKLDAVREV